MEILRGDYRIPDQNFDEFMKRLDKLNKIGQKLNCKPIVANIIKQDNEKQTDGSMIIYRTISILGEAPVLENWRFVATIQHLKTEGGYMVNVVRVVPGAVIDYEEYQHAYTNCYHCGTDRYRKETYVVENIISNVQRQVGRSCLKDFIGHISPHRLASWAEELGIFDEWAKDAYGYEATGSKYYPLVDYLAWVAKAVRESGWSSSTHVSQYGGVSTAHQAWNDKFAPNLISAPKQYPSLVDIDKSRTIYDYVQKFKDPSFEPVNSYMQNLQSIVKADVVDSKLIGLAASMYVVHANHEKRELEKAHRVDTSKSRFIGSPGEKHTFDALVTAIIPFDSVFGVSELIKLVDDEGNVLTWMKSSGSKHITDLATGRHVVAYGTIKKHNEYKGIQETVLTRCKILEVYDEPANIAAQ